MRREFLRRVTASDEWVDDDHVYRRRDWAEEEANKLIGNGFDAVCLPKFDVTARPGSVEERWVISARRRRSGEVPLDLVPRPVGLGRRPQCRHQWGPWRQAAVSDDWRQCSRCHRVETRKPRQPETSGSSTVSDRLVRSRTPSPRSRQWHHTKWARVQHQRAEDEEYGRLRQVQEAQRSSEGDGRAQPVAAKSSTMVPTGVGDLKITHADGTVVVIPAAEARRNARQAMRSAR